MNIDEVIQQPGQKERILKEDVLKTIHVAVPGEIVSYDSTKRMATVQPVIRDWDSTENPPLLTDVPVFMWGNFTFTPQAGDGCLVICADSAVDSWLQSGGISSPVVARVHSLSDGFALCGFNQTGGIDLKEALDEKVGLNVKYSDDLNQALDTGFYRYDTGSANVPLNGWGNVIVIKGVWGNNTIVSQIAIIGDWTRLYARRKDASNNWSEWTMFANDSLVVHNTGNETISGEKRFEGAVRIANNSTTPFVTFTGKNNTARVAGIQVEGSGSSTAGYYPASTMEFFNYSPNSDYSGLTSHYEMFKLPQVTVNLDGSKSYKIITEKNLSDIPGFPCEIYLTSTDTTASLIWAKINQLSNGDSCTIYIQKNAMNAISGGVRNDYSYAGVAARYSTSNFIFLVKPYNGDNIVVSFSSLGMSASSLGTYSEQCFDNNTLVHLAGTETITGEKWFKGNIRVANANAQPAISFLGKNNTVRTAGIQVSGAGSDASGYYGASQIQFFNYSPKSDHSALTSFYEMFKLPQVDVERDGSQNYNIITEKNLSDITGYPSQIVLSSTDTTWDKIWAKINVLATGDSATFYAHGNAMSALTNGTITSTVHIGVITRTASAAFQYLLKNSNNVIRVFNMTSVSSSSAGTFAGKDYDDDILIHTTQYQNTDFGSVTIANFQTALDTLIGTLDEGAMVSFKVSFTDSSTVLPSGAKTGIAVKGISTRRNAILQHSGSTAVNVYLGSYTSSGWVWKKNALDDAVVHNTGAETVSGAKTFSAVPIMRNAQQYPAIQFCGNKNENVGAGIQAMNIGSSSTEYYGQTQFGFFAYSPSSDNSSITSNFERFLLPAVNKNRSESEDFNIITTKNLSDITGVVHTSGAESIGGTKTFTTIPQFKNGTSPGLYFLGTNLSSITGVLRFVNAELSGQKYGQPQFSIYEYSPDSNGSARAGGYELYQLPAPDVGRSSSNNGTYSIITQKNLSDIDMSQLDGSTLPGVAHVQYTTIAKSSSKVFTMGNTSRVRIDFFGVANGLLGTTLVASTSTAGTCYVKSDLGSDITITKSGGTFTVANGNASYTLACYITLYGGSITY